MDEDARAANLREALVLLNAARLPEAFASAEALAAEIEAAMEAVGWTRMPSPVEPLVRRLCDLLMNLLAGVSPPLPNPCGRFMCAQCEINLRVDPHTPAAQ